MFLKQVSFFCLTELSALKLTMDIYRLKIGWAELLAISLFHSLFFYYINAQFSDHPLIRFLLSCTAMLLLGIIFLRLKAFYSIFVLLSAYLIYIALLESWLFFTLGSESENYFSILQSWPATIANAAGVSLLFLSLSFLVKHFKLTLVDEDINELNLNKNCRTICWVSFLIYLQSILVIYDFLYQQLSEHNLPKSFYLASTLFFLALLLFIFRKLFKLLKNEVNFIQTQEQLEYLSKLNSTLKRQAHDFNHHLQLIMTLIQMQKYKQVNSYIREISQESVQLFNNINTGIPPLDALLHYKISLAKKHDIKLKIKIFQQLNNIILSQTEITRVIGNLLGNAIEYLAAKKEIEEKEIKLSIEEKQEGFKIIVSNPVANEPILTEKLEKIFEPGESSKGEGRGLGLAIVKGILSQKGGKIKAAIDPQKNTLNFQLYVPKAKKATPNLHLQLQTQFKQKI